jgi:hypothetical protein
MAVAIPAPQVPHRACGCELLEAFTAGMPLLAGASRVGDPIAVLPRAYHTLWRRELACDMSVLLSGASATWRIPAGASR